MSDKILALGVDCGGTHTDAVLLEVSEESGQASLLASAKTATRHGDLPLSITSAIGALTEAPNFPTDALSNVDRATLGTTLAINAITQDKADTVALALSAGPGLHPIHFGLGEFVCVVPGGLDHRGVEVSRLYTDVLKERAMQWRDKGVRAVACVGKFSPRNPEHEERMAEVASRYSGCPVTMGHMVSGRLNFPRRIATAYYNAAVANLHGKFLDAVEQALARQGIKAGLRLLKADGGAIPFSLSRREPVQSILSGPAASVMGALALWRDAADCSLIIDMGGTTTDIAMLLHGSPVVDRDGMIIRGRRTLVRSLASISIGVGGDSLLKIKGDAVRTGPLREGPAMAFGGCSPTLLDALNLLDGRQSNIERGDVDASCRGMESMAVANGLSATDAKILAEKAVKDALRQIGKAVYDLVENINARPIYTLAALKAVREARPTRICLVGGPSQCIHDRLAQALGMEVDISPYPQVANAIGAALTLPTASLEIYADTGKGILSAPAYDYTERISRNFTLEEAERRAKALLREKLEAEGIQDAKLEVVDADLFATLDDRGYGSRDIRVACQVCPGILAKVR